MSSDQFHKSDSDLNCAADNTSHNSIVSLGSTISCGALKDLVNSTSDTRFLYDNEGRRCNRDQNAANGAAANGEPYFADELGQMSIESIDRCFDTTATTKELNYVLRMAKRFERNTDINYRINTNNCHETDDKQSNRWLATPSLNRCCADDEIVVDSGDGDKVSGTHVAFDKLRKEIIERFLTRGSIVNKEKKNSDNVDGDDEDVYGTTVSGKQPRQAYSDGAIVADNVFVDNDASGLKAQINSISEYSKKPVRNLSFVFR